jgi:hypothetical protein
VKDIKANESAINANKTPSPTTMERRGKRNTERIFFVSLSPFPLVAVHRKFSAFLPMFVHAMLSYSFDLVGLRRKDRISRRLMRARPERKKYPALIEF